MTNADLINQACDETTEADLRRVSGFVGSMPYTTVILRLMAHVARTEFEDEKGADMLDAFAAEFAKHEAGQL